MSNDATNDLGQGVHGTRHKPAGPIKPVIGLAGGIGSGKTVVAEMLASLGAAVIDSDALAHEQLRDPAVIATLRAWWGEGICEETGRVDRRAIARIVFSDASELARLEGLLYPRMARCREALMEQYQADPHIRAIVLDSPKLFEVGLDESCDAVVFIEADRSVRLRRVREGRGWTEADLDRREKLLNPLDSKRAKADYVIVNHSRMDALRPKVERVFSAILACFS